MNTEKVNQEDQATQLKKLFNELQQNEINEEEYEQKNDVFVTSNVIETEVQPKIDVLDLPPRKEVHDVNRTRTKLKIGRPMIRLIFVFTILVIAIASAYYFFGKEIIAIINHF